MISPRNPSQLLPDLGLLRAALVLLLTLGPGTSSAGFDPDSGRVKLSPLGVTFDDPDALQGPMPVWVSPGDGSPPIEASALSPLFVPVSESIEGRGALRLGADAQWITLDLSEIAETLRGRRIEIRFWQRPDGRRLGGGLFWSDPAGKPFPPLRLHPTGQVTDDGWEAWSSGPVDAWLGGQLPPTALELGDEAAFGPFAKLAPLWPSGASLGVVIDALQVVDLGPARTEAHTCAGDPRPDPCGAGGVCLLGRCSDRVVVFGAPPVPARLTGVLSRRILEVALFEGGQRSRRALPEALPVFAAAANAPPFGFNAQLAAGGRLLRDDHHASPDATSWWRLLDHAPFVGCAMLGEADLLPGSPRLPLVLESAISGLRPGDAIVAIDGEPALEWLAHHDPLLDYSGDPAGRESSTALHLLGLATLFASRLDLARCETGVDPATSLCRGAMETRQLALAEAVRDATWSAGAQGGFAGRACAPRVQRRLGAPRLDPGGGESAPFVGDAGNLRYLRFDDFLGRKAAFAAALADAPARLILDERIGHGGFSSEVDHLASYLVAADEGLGFENASFADASISDAEWLGLRRCFARGGSCGGFRTRTYPVAPHPAPSAAADTRIAVLTTRDVSGNDFITALLAHRTAPTRIFGPAPTAGAFGQVAGLPRRAGEGSGGGIQIADSRAVVGGVPRPTFLTGEGVPPDLLILQRQSDLLRGVDTILEEARAWVQKP